MNARNLAALGCAALVALAVPSAAQANDVFAPSWGGIEFADSDRNQQAGGDTYAIGVDPDTGGLLSVARASSAQWAYRYQADGRQTQRFRLKKSVTAITGLAGGEVLTGTAVGRVDRYGRNGKAGGSFDAGGRVTAITADPGGVLVATATALTRYSPSGAKGATLPITGVKGVDVGADGAIYVADGKTARVYSSDGTLVRTLTGLEAPDQIGVDGAGRAYVHDASQAGFGVKVFAADGRLLGTTTAGFYDLQSEATDRALGPLLLAVATNGDVYFTAQNPDILKIPVSLVPTPRFRISDESRGVPQFHDTDPIAVSVGKPARFTTNVFRSLTETLSIGATGDGFELDAAQRGSRPVSIAPGSDFASLAWDFRVNRPGRVPVRITASGIGPDGRPTASSKTLPVYGVDGPNITILGAATRRGATYSLVAIQVDIGKTKIAKADRYDLIEYLSNTFDVETTVRIDGKPVEDLGYQIGGSLTGMCVPFPTTGTPKIAVSAAIAAADRFAGATAKRTVRVTTKPKSELMRDCYEAIDLAGL